MPAFSARSRAKLEQCHPHLQAVCERVVELFDVTVVTGHRSLRDQQEAFEAGHSKAMPGRSRHNSLPSMAVDLAPWNPTPPHIRWRDTQQWLLMAGIVLGVAHAMGIKLRWGADWDGDWDFREHSLFDPGHFELVESSVAPPDRWVDVEEGLEVVPA